MTDRPDAEKQDALVSRTYHELDAPRTPDHLNESVLRLATRQAKRGSNRLFTNGFRPAAWAATAALSLAIVMQFADLTANRDAVRLEDLALDDAAILKSEAKRGIDAFSVSAPAGPATATLAATECSAMARRSVDTWLECIDNLRASGAIGQADHEYQILILEYPEKAVSSTSNK